MSRQKVIRFGALLALVTMASHGNPATAEAMKGIRALVFSGETLREPVRIHDAESATAVWLSLRGGPVLPQDSVVMLSGHRCIVISAFIFNQRNENVPVDELPAGRGDYNYTMYLFGQGTRPVMFAGNRVWKLNVAAAQELAALGVPVADTTRTTTGC